MGLTVGPATWHPDYQRYLACACPLGTAVGGGFLFSRADGVALIVAPYSTQLSSQWAGGQYNTTAVGTKCCVSEWSGLQTALTSAGLTPSQWFMPTEAQLVAAYPCRTFWGNTNPCFTVSRYWTSREVNIDRATHVKFEDGFGDQILKSTLHCVRAFRCITY